MQKLFEFVEHIGKWRVLVQTRDIQDGAITAEKIANGAITDDKLAPGAITSIHVSPLTLLEMTGLLALYSTPADTIEELRVIDEAWLRDGVTKYVKETGTWYQWNSSNDSNDTTGRWQPIAVGMMPVVQVFSDKGVVVTEHSTERTLTATVTLGITDITDTLRPEAFRWTRMSSDAASDAAWNAGTHIGNTLVVNRADILKMSQFDCWVNISLVK